jgi:hypothetical protein
MHFAVPGNHAIARVFFFLHTEVMTLMLRQPIQLYKTPRVTKLLYPFPCRKFPFFVLIFNLLFPSSQEGAFPQFPQPFDPLRTQLIHQDNPFNDKTGT